jgi:ABC-type dipeptide/oligopeptide/nickel transport system permease subunit
MVMVPMVAATIVGWVNILAMRFTDMMFCILPLVLMVIVTFEWMSRARLVCGRVSPSSSPCWGSTSWETVCVTHWTHV